MLALIDLPFVLQRLYNKEAKTDLDKLPPEVNKMVGPRALEIAKEEGMHFYPSNLGASKQVIILGEKEIRELQARFYL